MALPKGTRVGSYEILSEIGAGGMGEVYLARDSRLGRDVAIKVLPDSFTSNAERTARFEREAKLLATLNQKNIASIYGIEDSNGSLALVMEFVDGPTLADRIRSGPPPMDEVLPIARQIADGLEYAHEHGIVHRDLKPANVKVTPDDDVKILDFGLAKAAQVEAESSDVRNSPTITQMATQAGVLLGTAAYMSPEQVKGKRVDRRTDIWAFGCVLYEMLTGNMAFHGESVPETLAAVLNSEPNWSLLPSATPIRVRVLLQRCLQKDPKQRLRDIGDARISLDEVLTGPADNVPGLAIAPPLWRRALPWALFGVTAFALALISFVHFHQKPSAPPDTVRFQIAWPEKTSSITDLSLSPDGRHLAFTTIAEDGSSQLWLHDLDSLAPRPLPGTDGARSPFWSPDSRTVVFLGRGRLERVDISGGAPQAICAIDRWSPVYGGAWNPDGVIVFGSDKGIMKVSAAGGVPSILIKVRRSIGPSLSYPSFLPDGRHFLYDGLTASGTNTYVGSLDQEDEPQFSKPLVTSASLYVPASGNAPGSILFRKNDRTLMVQAFDASRMELKGDPIPVADGVRFVTVSANGVLAYSGGNQTPLQLTWFDRAGNILGRLGQPGISPPPAISPDGRTVAVSQPDNAEGRTDIWLYDLQRGTPTRFTSEGAVNLSPVWSPDGTRIAFFSPREGALTVYQKLVNGVGREEAFKAGPPDTTMPLDWSLDGRYLIEEVYGDTRSIWMLPLSPGQAGGEQKPIPLLRSEGSNASHAKLSPDGKWIAYVSTETGRGEIFVRTFPNLGGEWHQVSTNGGTRPVWSRDGKELYFIAPDRKLMAVDVKCRPDGSFDYGVAKALFDPHAGPFPADSFDVSKDGRFLVPVLTQQSGGSITVVVNWQSQTSK